MIKIVHSPYILLLFFLSIFLFSGCDSGYKGTFPPVVLEFATILSDEEGQLVFLITDEGHQYAILRDRTNTKLNPKEYKRVVCYYELSESKEGVILYTLSESIASVPIPRDKVEEIKNGPITVQSSWIGGGYLNLIVQVRLKDPSEHTFAFIEDEISFIDGVQKVSLSLYHDEGNDFFSHTDRSYFSIPLHQYLLNDKVNAVEISFSYFDYSGNRQIIRDLLEKEKRE